MEEEIIMSFVITTHARESNVFKSCVSAPGLGKAIL